MIICTLSVPAHGANMCTANSSFSMSSIYTPSNIGSVTLNKTVDILSGIDDIKGAAYNPKKGEIVFAGHGEIPLAEQIDLDDLVVAVRSTYDVQQDPGITFAGNGNTLAGDAMTSTGGTVNVNYFGATKDPNFGQILFDANYVLKQLTLVMTA